MLDGIRYTKIDHINSYVDEKQPTEWLSMIYDLCWPTWIANDNKKEGKKFFQLPYRLHRITEYRAVGLNKLMYIEMQTTYRLIIYEPLYRWGRMRFAWCTIDI